MPEGRLEGEVEFLSVLLKQIATEPEDVSLEQMAREGFIRLYYEPEHSLSVIETIKQKYGISDEDLEELRWAFKMVERSKGGEVPLKVELEPYGFVNRRYFTNLEFINLNNLELRQTIGEHMMFELCAWLASEKLASIHVKYPEDWWQAFKERWFPRWLLKRFPVKYHEERYEARAFYPDVSLPTERHYVRIVTVVPRKESDSND